MTQPTDPDNDSDNDSGSDTDDHPVILGGFLWGAGVSHNDSKHDSRNTAHHPSMKTSAHHKDRPPDMGRHRK